MRAVPYAVLEFRSSYYGDTGISKAWQGPQMWRVELSIVDSVYWYGSLARLQQIV